MKIKINRIKVEWEAVVNAFIQYCKGAIYYSEENEVVFYNEDFVCIKLRSDGTWYTE